MAGEGDALRDRLRAVVQDVGVDVVAQAVGVNRRDVYAWLNGKSEPWRAAREALEALLRARGTALPTPGPAPC